MLPSFPSAHGLQRSRFIVMFNWAPDPVARAAAQANTPPHGAGAFLIRHHGRLYLTDAPVALRRFNAAREGRAERRRPGRTEARSVRCDIMEFYVEDGAGRRIQLSRPVSAFFAVYRGQFDAVEAMHRAVEWLARK